MPWLPEPILAVLTPVFYTILLLHNVALYFNGKGYVVLNDSGKASLRQLLYLLAVILTGIIIVTVASSAR